MTRIITNKLIRHRTGTTVEQVRSRANTRHMNCMNNSYRADRGTYGAAAAAAAAVLVLLPLSPMSLSMKRLPMSGKKSSLGK